MESVSQLQNELEVANFGGKAANLSKMLKAGLPVPRGIAIGINGFDTGKLTPDTRIIVEDFLIKDKLYAVRSSALAEDTEKASWAGLFETYLDIKPEDVISKIELCHSSAKSRAIAYAEDKTAGKTFDIAVVVQEMVNPEYAGVLFTKDPVSGKDQLVTEYVSGLGEELVSGRADPIRIVLSEGADTPFDVRQLAELAAKVEQLFGVPQDIEWALADDKMWLVQARPITALQEMRKGYYLGEPDDLFYWGPTRAKPMYMSDFIAACERFFVFMTNDLSLPSPPKTITIFEDNMNVWLINAKAFVEFTEKTFEAYAILNQLDQDIANWKSASEKLSSLNGSELNDTLIDAWFYTEFAEFSLYGAESALIKQLSRFDATTRQDIWRAFTVPDKPTFLARIDIEFAASKDPNEMAKKYPWIKDGYDGVSPIAQQYFEERLTVVGSDTQTTQSYEEKRHELTGKLGLSDKEVSSLTLARKLAEFMDERKAWMMKTRRLMKEPIGNLENGWFFNEGRSSSIGSEDAHELWQRYIDFKASTKEVAGIVASNGGKHFVNGEVVIVTSPTDSVEDNRIVVVPSTSPSYVPLMRKAKALVTDHGGMMSHAAIVAREFNLPCIVGTKHATKILETGDRVVLDLVKGEVNK